MASIDECLYQHSPLHQHTSIRLLTLLPGPYHSPLRCHITECHDRQTTRYEALSYAWGEPGNDDIILVCNSANNRECCIPIRRNLGDGLRRLRLTKPRTLWIDALCINQDDLDEKMHQVAHMGRIYREASAVVVWLGEDESWDLVKIFLPIWQTVYEYGRLHHQKLESDVHRVPRLLGISWFSRVWILQEFLLARSVYFQMGSHEFSESRIKETVMAPGFVPDGLLERPDMIHRPGSVNPAEVTDSEVIESEEIKSEVIEPEVIESLGFIQRLFEYRDLLQSPQVFECKAQATLTQCFLDLSRQRSCMDDRDRIYAMLGIAHDLNIIPNYTLSAKVVYADFVSKSLKSGDFSILYACCIDAESTGLPSYVPPFGKLSYVPIGISRSIAYINGLHLPKTLDVDPDSYLHIKGIYVDTICGKLDFNTTDDELDRYSPLFLEDSSWCSEGRRRQRISLHNRPSSCLVAGAPNSIAVSRCFMAMYIILMSHMVSVPEADSCWRMDVQNCFAVSPAHVRKPKRLQAEGRNKFQMPTFSHQPYLNETLYNVFLSVISINQKEIEGLGRFLPANNPSFAKVLRPDEKRRLIDRCIFWTKNGVMGLSGSQLQPGDVVAALDGAPAPILLRKDVNEHGKESHISKIVGDCYVHGWKPRTTDGVTGLLKDLYGDTPPDSTTFIIG
ncbi:heterokaryon incompatibility protein-domain-containing protein [Boeremia exigua]|uniref:heterokaryon incompatibility protein-domain-containing protein n=1 Tax=Boeremia exigua TaxID=749465 RepID=UPI001E8ECE7D|nr:heterokaryon incompatibility protein-domain-containing protein [Boeremia exigua]KAH6638919.1 heterokaryon incompatibility protein-domain-containing protein [Boeremia exigua]